MKKLAKYLTAAFVTAAAAAAAMTFSCSAEGWISGGEDVSLTPYLTNADFNVWVNGRDVKDNTKTPEDETSLNKTGVIQHYAMSGGGKWNVAVTSVNINTPNKFLALVDSKGKVFDPKAADNKLIATAKIKDGEITVTAGREEGQVNVWVYETNKNGVVYLPTRGVVPAMYTVNVKMSPGSPTIAEPEDVLGGVLKAGAKAITKVSLGYDPSTNIQDSLKLALCDKKTAWDISSGFSIAYSNGDKSTTASVVSVSLASDGETMFVTPISVGKSTVTITSNQSGKAAKLTVEVKSKYKVNYDPRYVSVEDLTDKNNPLEVRNGESLIDGSTVKITAVEGVEVDQIEAYGKAVKSGSAVKITGMDLNIAAGKLYNLTVTGADRANTVMDGTKAVSSGKFMTGTILTLTVEKDVIATVTSGTDVMQYPGDGFRKFAIEITGETKIEITKP